MTKPKILLQLDADAQPSVFDSVVAIDAGVDHLLRHQGIRADNVRELVHGAIFTRGPADLHSTALFVGGSDVAAGEAVFAEIERTFFGPMRVSVMLDPAGANTTAAAAVLAAAKHVPLAGATALVLASTGPVGQRVVRLLARAGAQVRAVSRSQARAQEVCDAVAKQVAGAELSAFGATSHAEVGAAIEGCQIVIAAGAPGVELLAETTRRQAAGLRVAIDLNAVPPAGLAGVGVMDKAVEKDGVVCYGAIGVGGTKMKIHKAAIQRLFASNDQLLDAEQLFEIGQSL
ncbi:MAG TPA: NAD(P)-dependent methylenetetrahydromethanopterin dehydrogenase [Pirellulales bacterium]|nr:NAD(P)-dependent methylenetetrahydromethanopterin dehydrogenase [Pirellulales bacterium]